MKVNFVLQSWYDDFAKFYNFQKLVLENVKKKEDVLRFVQSCQSCTVSRSSYLHFSN